MFSNWLRSNKYAALMLTLLRIYVGYEFMMAGFEKLTGAKAFDATGFLKNSIAHPVVGPDKAMVFPTFHAFLQNFALPHVGLFNFLVPWGELLVGIGLILGVLTTSAMFFGMLMNFMYLMAGTVSTNPWDLLIGAFIVAAGLNAGKIGGDFWVIPWLRNLFARKNNEDSNHNPRTPQARNRKRVGA